ncbi:MAG: hypothetical protein LIP77_00120 [Planctomycetes bacterium]|nr:hypothetical protein [Planctomycetota bacterium]
MEKLTRAFPILLLTVGHGAVDFYIGLLQVVAPGLAVYLGLPLGQLVFLMGAANLLNNLTQPLTGYLMGRRNLAWVLWGAVMLSALPAFMGFAGGIVSLSALVLAGAVGTGLYHPEGALSAHEASGDRAYLGVPLFMAGGAAIYAVGTPLSLWISEHRGFPALAWLALPGLIVGGVFLLRHRHLKHTHPSVVLRPRSRRLSRNQPGDLSFWPLLAVATCLMVGSGLFLAMLSSHYELLFGPGARAWSSWVLMVVGFGGSLCSFLWSALTRRFGFFPVALVTQVAACGCFLLLAVPSSPAMGFLFAMPLSLVYPNAVFPVAVTLARNTAGMTQGLRTSIIMGGTSGLSAIAVMAAGRLIDRGVPTASLMVFIALCSLAAAVLSAWQLLRRRPAPAI